MRDVDTFFPPEYERMEFLYKGRLNPKKYDPGTVVYFVRRDPKGFDRHVKFGTVIDNYASEVCIQLYEPLDRRLINGIPYKEFETPTRWQKIPKGYENSSDLYEQTSMEWPELAKTLTLDTSENIKKAIDEGILVPVQDIDHSHIEVRFDVQLGYQLVKSSWGEEHHQDYVCVRHWEVLETREEAQEICDAWKKHYEDQENMSEEEWSISLIDEDLNRWALMYDKTEMEKLEIRDWIMKLKNIEDVETRISYGEIQWKYWDKKRWMNINL